MIVAHFFGFLKNKEERNNLHITNDIETIQLQFMQLKIHLYCWPFDRLAGVRERPIYLPHIIYDTYTVFLIVIRDPCNTHTQCNAAGYLFRRLRFKLHKFTQNCNRTFFSLSSFVRILKNYSLFIHLLLHLFRCVRCKSFTEQITLSNVTNMCAHSFSLSIGRSTSLSRSAFKIGLSFLLFRFV